MRPSHRRAAGQRATARVQGFPQQRVSFSTRVDPEPQESKAEMRTRLAAKRLLFRLEDLRKEQADWREDGDG